MTFVEERRERRRRHLLRFGCWNVRSLVQRDGAIETASVSGRVVDNKKIIVLWRNYGGLISPQQACRRLTGLDRRATSWTVSLSSALAVHLLAQTTLDAKEKESQLFWIVALQALGELVAASGRR